MRTAVVYIRVSTDEQADKGYSQRYQQEVLEKYCQLNLIEVQRWVFEDHSAKTFNRPAWKKLLLDLKRKRRERPDLILFTKWDRFSRNTADAYQMIRFLNELDIDPQAIEQPLDLAVPENKMMLAFYLAVPEVENDRRALNVIGGMRRAQKEGRWMGAAPYGYDNKITEQGRKYIAPNEQAKLMQWALEEIATGKFNVMQIWHEAQKKGFNCAKSNFYRLIRNPVYCGLIIVAAYKDESERWVKGLHKALISEATYWAIQKALERTKPVKQKTQLRLRPELILRGFLNCPQCGKTLTGSGSMGRRKLYHYYHCYGKCSYRVRADKVNAAFVGELKDWQPDTRFQILYQTILNADQENRTRDQRTFRSQVSRQIDMKRRRLTKARELLLNGGLEVDEYQEIKTAHQIQLEELQHQLDTDIDPTDRFGPPIKINHKLAGLDEYYHRANIKNKRRLIALLFPGNMIFNDGHFDFRQLSSTLQLIYPTIYYSSEKTP